MAKTMRPSSPTFMLTAVLAVALAVSAAHAQPFAGASGDAAAQAATTQPAGPVRTSKERLGNKWSDEQRVDNCKVPPDKRGPKPRPDTCAEAVTD
jgi:hypothetical protein